MDNALVLTQEKADTLGYSGPGPFTFAGAFPGEYMIGRPLETRFLDFDDDDALRAAFDAAFGNLDVDRVPLEWVAVDVGEGLPIRVNHAETAKELSEEAVDAAVEEKAGGKIGNHAEADAVAEELGISWPEGETLTLAEKKQAIESFQAAGANA